MLTQLALAQMLFNAIFQFSNLFINTYLFKLHHDLQIVAEYNFFLYLSWGICFYLGFKCCERNTRIGMVISGIAGVLGMLMLILNINEPRFLGLFMGSIGGFFWPSYLSIYRQMGKVSEGAGTFARVSILASAVTIAIPLLFGHLVEGQGYLMGFIILILLSISMMGISFYMPGFRTEKVVLQRQSFTHFRFLSSNVLQGFYFSFINIAAGLLVYLTGGGEAKVGTFATYYGIVTLAVNILMGYVLSQRYNSLGMFLSPFIYLGAASLFFTEWDNRIIAYNFLVAGAGPLFLNPNVGLNFSYINRSFANGEEGLFVRECALSVGRLLFFVFLAFFGGEVLSDRFSLFLLGFSLFPLTIMIIIRKWEGMAFPIKQQHSKT